MSTDVMAVAAGCAAAAPAPPVRARQDARMLAMMALALELPLLV